MKSGLKGKTISPNSVFYIHNLSSGSISWFGDIEKFFGVSEGKLSKRSEYIEILNKSDRDPYNFNISNFVDEISCEYKINKGKEKVSVREIATKSELNGEVFMQGMITLNPSRSQKKHGNYTISSKSILTGKLDSNLLEEIKKTYKAGDEKKENYVLILISIDNLPMIATWHGNEASRSVMYDLKDKISGVLLTDSKILKVGPEQIAVISKNPTNNEVEQFTNKVNNIINLYKHPKFEEATHLRLSIGSAYYPLGSKSELDVVNKAFLALTNVKGKDYEFYCDFEDAKRDHIDAQNEMTQLHYLQEAFHNEKLILAYQPIISSKSGDVEYYECLLRIDEGGGYYSSAGRFIPLAEKMGTVDIIDEFVLKKVVEVIKENPEVKLALNVSNLTTGNDAWLKMCNEILSEEDIAKRISIEITETAAQKDLRKTAFFTASMQSLGCKVALDDFGVGYTSFRQLRSLSVDTVKIDGSYILGLEENKENLIFIKSLVDFNHSYGLKTVAECVENGEVAKQLMNMGVDLMQGYYFGMPEVEKPWLNSKKSVKTG